MRRVPSLIIGFCCTTLVLAGCGSGDGDAADTVAADTAAAVATPAASTVSLAPYAGRWNMRAVPESGADTSATTFVLTATADTTGWTLAFPNRDPIPVRILSVSGDSIVTEIGPYESARRAGVQATTTSVWRMQGDRIVGSTIARYQTTGADSVLRLRSEGTRAP